jgi:hypothetical protein
MRSDYMEADRSVNSSDSNASVSTATDLIGSVLSKGVKLWSQDGRLHYKAPVGALTAAELAQIGSQKAQLLTLLDGETHRKEAHAQAMCSPPVYRAPLAFSQLAHWNHYRLKERAAVRQIASATRLGGRLDVAGLRNSLDLLIERHEALRTRIVVSSEADAPLQEIGATMPWELEVEELTAFPQSEREGEILRQIVRFILEPIDVTKGPLFGVRLLKLGADEHVLIIALEHMISDAFSMGLLLRDLFALYAVTQQGRCASLPEVSLQFSEYALWQRNTLHALLQTHAPYWEKRNREWRRLRFPVDEAVKDRTAVGWGMAPLLIQNPLKLKLLEWCRRQRTTLVMAVLAAYIGLILRWCNRSDLIIYFETDGRDRPEIANAIGYFATGLYLSVHALEHVPFLELLDRVTKAYCEAYERRDFSYVDTQLPRPEFTANTAFNWIPQRSTIKVSELEGLSDPIEVSSLHFEHPMSKSLETDSEPVMLLYDTETQVVGGIHYPLKLFSAHTMERLAYNFSVFLQAILDNPEKPVGCIALA